MNPSYEQRFASQIAHARKSRPNADEDYGMKLDGGHIFFDKWRGCRDFFLNSYEFDEESVKYRGLNLQTGDVILCNRARDSDGIFTTLVEGRQSFSHVAMFAILEDEGQKFPAVIEIQQEGVRAVPLRVFAGSSFSTYVEVYRSRQMSAKARKMLAIEALAMMRETHGFDILMDDTQDVYMSCALMVSHLFKRAGLTPIEGGSVYSLKTLSNLYFLGVESCAGRPLLMPDDYSRSADFYLVGQLDNGCFVDLVARALVRERMQEIWQTKKLDPKLFPIEFLVNKVAVSCVKRRVLFLGEMVSRKMGFTLDTFPSGPVNFIALTPIVERRIEKAASQVAQKLKNLRSDLLEKSSWDRLSRSPRLKTLVRAAMSDFEALFREI